MQIPKLTWNRFQEKQTSGMLIWIAECNEYDMAVQALNEHILEERIQATIAGHIAICEREGITPFESIKKTK